MRHRRILERFDRRAPSLLSLRSVECGVREIVLQDTGEVISAFMPEGIEELRLERVELASMSLSSDSTRLTLRLLITDPSDSGSADITLVDRRGNRRQIHLSFPQSSFALEELLSTTESVIPADDGAIRCNGFAVTNSRNERLVVAYNVQMPGGVTVNPTTGGTPDLESRPDTQYANLLWDSEVTPGDPVFNREIRAAYRIGGDELDRASLDVKIVTGTSGDQEKPIAGNADTYLQLFGIAEPNNSARVGITPIRTIESAYGLRVSMRF
jgi:cell surface protein SprA